MEVLMISACHTYGDISTSALGRHMPISGSVVFDITVFEIAMVDYLRTQLKRNKFLVFLSKNTCA